MTLAEVRPRDSQRSKLYAAERSTPMWGAYRLESVADCQAFIDSVMASRWVAVRWRQRVEVRPGFGHRNATGEPINGIIQAPRWARTKIVMLHELSHVLLGPRVDWAWHGPEFAGLYLKLVEHTLGADDAGQLRAAYKARRVRSSLAGVRSPRYVYVAKKEVVAALRAADRKPPSQRELMEAAAVIRRAARVGMLGAAERKPRQHALATARLLDSAINANPLAASHQNS